MNCRAFEPLIALYAGRDLDGRDIVRVEEHLAVCSDCRQLLEGLQESRGVLKELSAEPVDAALLAAVRSGVLKETGEPRRTVWPWVAALVAAAALTIAIVPHKPAPQPNPAPIVAQAPERSEGLLAQVNRPKPRRRRAVRRTPTPSAEPLVVKMLTDDPDIVIIWLVDKQGD